VETNIISLIKNSFLNVKKDTLQDKKTQHLYIFTNNTKQYTQQETQRLYKLTNNIKQYTRQYT